MTGIRLSVDYGTSHTVAMLALPDGRVRPLLFDGSPLLPSAVYVEADGSIRTGRDAVNSAKLDPSRYEPHPKRRVDDVELVLGGSVRHVRDLISATLRRVAEEVTRTVGTPVTVVMTCPVAWGPMRRSTLLAAAERAGLPAPTLVAEPVAAAAYFAATTVDVPVGGNVVVYDLGGGTFDVCVVRRDDAGFTPLAYRGLDDFGGVDLDALVVQQIGASVGTSEPEVWTRLTAPEKPGDARQARMLWDDARTAKETLSRYASTQVVVHLADQDAQVSREAFELAARPALVRTADVTAATLRESQVAAGAIAGLFLVGGSTRVPLVTTVLHDRIGVVPSALDQPETVVAEGALVVTGAPATTPPVPVPPIHPSSPGPVVPAPAGPPAPVSAVPVSPVPPSGPGVPGPAAPAVPVAPPLGGAPEPPKRGARRPSVPLAMGAALALGGAIMLLIPLGYWSGEYDEAVILWVSGTVIYVGGGFLTWLAPSVDPPYRFVPAGMLLILSIIWFSSVDEDVVGGTGLRAGVGLIVTTALFAGAAGLCLRRGAPRGPDGTPPREPIQLWILPVLGIAFSVVGLVEILLPLDFEPESVEAAVGLWASGTIALVTGGVLTWFTPRLPLLARFWMPGVLLILSIVWYSVDLTRTELRDAAATGTGLLVCALVTGLLTTVTLRVRRREPVAGRS